MDGRGNRRHKVFVERLCCSAKYERIYLHAYDGVRAARAESPRISRGTNSERAHSNFDGATRAALRQRYPFRSRPS
jgi:putative transposase